MTTNPQQSIIQSPANRLTDICFLLSYSLSGQVIFNFHISVVARMHCTTVIFLKVTFTINGYY